MSASISTKSGKELKTAGQQIALFNAGSDWSERTIASLKTFCLERKASGRIDFRFEEFVQVLKSSGSDQPPSPNAYGALPRIACRNGLIAFTGQYENAQSPKTRCHPVKVWRAL